MVFVAGLEEGLLPHGHARAGEETVDSRAGERRAACVAVTRPRQRLYLTCCRSRVRAGAPFTCRPSRFLEDLVGLTLSRAFWRSRGRFLPHEILEINDVRCPNCRGALPAHRPSPTLPGGRALGYAGHPASVFPRSGRGALRRRPHRAGPLFMGRCPLHEDRAPSFMVDERDQHYRCFGCRAHGDIIDLVRRLEGLDFRGAVARLAHAWRVISPSPARVRIKRPSRTVDQVSDEEARRCLAAATVELYRNQFLVAPTALVYLAGRGQERSVQERWRVGYAAGVTLLPYLRWRRLSSTAAPRAGILDRDGCERLFAGDDAEAARERIEAFRAALTAAGEFAGTLAPTLALPRHASDLRAEAALQRSIAGWGEHANVGVDTLLAGRQPRLGAHHGPRLRRDPAAVSSAGQPEPERPWPRRPASTPPT